MKLVIVAGGKGTRLGLTDIPKPMVKIAGKPLLEYQVELAKRYGVTDIVMLTGHLSEVIEDYFRDGSQWGVKISYLRESQPLGTAGAVRMAAKHLQERFLVFYGDIMLDLDISRFIAFDAKDPESLGTLLVHPNDHPYDSDLLTLNGDHRITEFHSKPHPAGLGQDYYLSNQVNAAVYILSPRIIDYIPADRPSDFGKDIFPACLRHGEILRGYPSVEYAKDVGTADRLAHTEQDVVSGKMRRQNAAFPKKAIFIDRDGVINRYVSHLSKIEDFELLNRVPEALKRLNQSDYLAILVTNQPMIAKGFLTEAELTRIHQKMETLLGQERAYFDGIYYCPHHPEKGHKGEVDALKIECLCRKPSPGMLQMAADQFHIDLTASWMIGDHERDILAGKQAGCRTLFIPPDNACTCPTADGTAKDFWEAVDQILRGKAS